MARAELVKYIKENLAKGYSISVLRKALIDKNWPVAEVDEAIKEVKDRKTQQSIDKNQPTTEKQSLDQILINFSKRIKEVLLKPSDFFESIREEKIELSLTYLLIFSIIFGIVDLIFGSNNILISTAILLAILVLPFLEALLFYLFVVLFKGEKGYLRMVGIVIYSNTPILLIRITFPLTGYIWRESISVVNTETLGLIIGITSVVLFTFLIIAWIYYFILLIKGIKILHEVSYLKSFLIVFLTDLVVTILVLISVVVLSMSLPLTLIEEAGFPLLTEEKTEPLNEELTGLVEGDIGEFLTGGPVETTDCLPTGLTINTSPSKSCYDNEKNEVSIMITRGPEDFELVEITLHLIGGDDAIIYGIKEESKDDIRMADSSYGTILKLPKENENKRYVIKNELESVEEVWATPIIRVKAGETVETWCDYTSKIALAKCE